MGTLLEWSYFEIHCVFFSTDFRCVSASHHFALFFFETGSLKGFVVLELPQYFFQRARKHAQYHTPDSHRPTLTS